MLLSAVEMALRPTLDPCYRNEDVEPIRARLLGNICGRYTGESQCQ